MHEMIQTTDLGPIQTDDFPALINPRIPQPTTSRTTGLVREPHEEAAIRFGLRTTDDHHNDDSTTTCTTPLITKERTVNTSTTTRNSSTHSTPKARTRDAWLRYQQASKLFYTACERYEVERRGIPGPAERTERQYKFLLAWENVTDELCLRYIKSKKAVRRAIAAQRRAEILDRVVASA